MVLWKLDPFVSFNGTMETGSFCWFLWYYGDNKILRFLCRHNRLDLHPSLKVGISHQGDSGGISCCYANFTYLYWALNKYKLCDNRNLEQGHETPLLTSSPKLLRLKIGKTWQEHGSGLGFIYAHMDHDLFCCINFNTAFKFSHGYLKVKAHGKGTRSTLYALREESIGGHQSLICTCYSSQPSTINSTTTSMCHHYATLRY